MAMVNCPECGGGVSSDALKCPHCGKQLRKPKRSFFGKICIWLFWLYNIMCGLWLWGGLNAASKMKAASDAEEVGRAIGTGLGVSMVVCIWLAGAIILGIMALLTRPKH